MNDPIFWRDAATGTFRYIAAEPTAERAPNGAPTLLLWLSGNDARLQLGAQWTLTETERAALLRRITAQYPHLAPAAIDLQPAPATIEEVALLTGDGRREWQQLAAAQSSGYVPYTTVFAQPLGEAQKQSALAAISGRRGFLAVRYRGRAQMESGTWEALERQADVADWFHGRRGSDHIRVIPSGAVAPSRALGPAALTILLEEGLKGAPVAFIRVESGGQDAMLRPPEFAPVTLPASATALRVTTHYTIGPPAYTSELGSTPGPEIRLTAAQVGVAAVDLSAPDIRDGNAREARVTVRYLPDGAGTADERTIYLRGEQWSERWWVVSRAPNFGGELEVTAKITYAAGRIENPPRWRQRDGTVVIAPA